MIIALIAMLPQYTRFKHSETFTLTPHVGTLIFEK